MSCLEGVTFWGRISPVMAVVSNLPAIAGDTRHGFDPGVGKIPWRRAWQSTPAFLPGESHGQRSLGGYSLHGHEELDMTEHTAHGRCSMFNFLRFNI